MDWDVWDSGLLARVAKLQVKAGLLDCWQEWLVMGLLARVAELQSMAGLLHCWQAWLVLAGGWAVGNSG